MDDEEQPLIHDATRIPLTNVLRLMKKVIPQYGKASKEAKQTVQDLIQEFIRFVTSEAKTVRQSEKRKVLGADDILQALENLGMKKYSEVLKVHQKNYRKSVTPAIEVSDAESEMVLVTVENENGHDSSGSTKPTRSEEPSTGLLADSLSEIHKSLGLPPIEKPRMSSATEEDNFASAITNDLFANEENSNPNIAAGSENIPTSNAFAETQLSEYHDSETSALTGTVHQNVIIPAWTIPAANISGITIPTIDIPELTVPIEWNAGDQPIEKAEEPALSTNTRNSPRARSVENDIALKVDSAGDEDGAFPSTEVDDLGTPTSHIPLQLLNPDALQPLDFGTLLEDSSQAELLKESFASALSPRAAGAQAAVLSHVPYNVDHFR